MSIDNSAEIAKLKYEPLPRATKSPILNAMYRIPFVGILPSLIAKARQLASTKIQGQMVSEGVYDFKIGNDAVVICDPESLVQIVKDENLTKHNSLVGKITQPAYKKGPLGLDSHAKGEDEAVSPYYRLRGAVIAALGGNTVKEQYLPIFDSAARENIDEYSTKYAKDGGGSITVPISHETATFAFDAMFKALFDIEIAEGANEELPEKTLSAVILPALTTFIAGIPVNKVPIISAIFNKKIDGPKGLINSLAEAFNITEFSPLEIEGMDVQNEWRKYLQEFEENGKIADSPGKFLKLLYIAQQIGVKVRVKGENGASEKDAGTLTLDESIGLIMHMVVAGHETTNSMLPKTIEDILDMKLSSKQQDKDNYNWLMTEINEIKRIISDNPGKRGEVIKQFATRKGALRAFIFETLRDAPVASISPFVAKKDIEYIGKNERGKKVRRKIKKGTNVMLGLAGIMKHPDHWNNPNEYNPSRYGQNKTNGSVMFEADNPFTYTVTKNDGTTSERTFEHHVAFAEITNLLDPSRSCWGKEFALQEMCTYLIELLLEYELQEINDTKVSTKTGAARIPNAKLRMRRLKKGEYQSYAA